MYVLARKCALVLNESRRGVTLRLVGESLEKGMVARLLPTVVQRTLIQIVLHLRGGNVFHFLVNSGVESIGT